MFKNRFRLVSATALTLASLSAFCAPLSCQTPYCYGTAGESTAASPPPVSNPRYCYQGRCYAGAYFPGAIDKNGHLPQDDFATMTPSDRLKQELATVGVERFTAPDYRHGLIRHIVLFRYGAQVSQEQKKDVKRRFLDLKRLATRNGTPYIVSIETGGENSGEGADQGLEQGFVVTFKSEGDRNYYVGSPIVSDPEFYDPAHQAFKDFVGPLLDQHGVVVFDFRVKN